MRKTRRAERRLRGGVACRYLLREAALAFLAVFALLFSVGLGGRFTGFLQEAASGRFAPEALWLLLVLRAPEFVQMTAPFAIFLALLLVLGRLHAEREYAALVFGRLAPLRILRWLLLAAMPVAALIGALSFWITPAARSAYADFALEQMVERELDAVIPGAFHVYDDGRRVAYAESVDREAGLLRGVFLAERSGAATISVWAGSGRQRRDPATGRRTLELENGIRYEGVPGMADYRVATFRRLEQRLETEPPPILADDARRVPTAALDPRDPVQAAERQWRAALPAMTLIAALLAFGIAPPAPRAGRFARLLPGVGAFVAYYLLLVYAQQAVADGALPPLPGLWLAHGAAAAAALWLIGRRRP